MAGKRRVLTPNRLTGWNPKHIVEIELIDRHRETTHSVYAVYLDGGLVGHALGYARFYGNRRPGWGYTPGQERPGSSRVAYVFDSRRQAVELLIEHALRGKGGAA